MISDAKSFSSLPCLICSAVFHRLILIFFGLYGLVKFLCGNRDIVFFGDYKVVEFIYMVQNFRKLTIDLFNVCRGVLFVLLKFLL